MFQSLFSSITYAYLRNYIFISFELHLNYIKKRIKKSPISRTFYSIFFSDVSGRKSMLILKLPFLTMLLKFFIILASISSRLFSFASWSNMIIWVSFQKENTSPFLKDFFRTIVIILTLFFNSSTSHLFLSSQLKVIRLMVSDFPSLSSFLF